MKSNLENRITEIRGYRYTKFLFYTLFIIMYSLTPFYAIVKGIPWDSMTEIMISVDHRQ